jgi:hypothetical protein
MRRRFGRAGAIALSLLTAVAGAAAARAAPAPLSLGFVDQVFDGPTSSVWLHRAAAASANVVRINIGWDAPNTPTKPAGFNARDPASSDYTFTAADAAIKAATANGLRVIVNFTGAPIWAEGPHMPRNAPPGTWEPNDRDIEDYAIALATRYSGRFPDPANPRHKLPKVWAFQLWNEPNLPDYLEPQFQDGRPASPVIYRGMLNAFYTGIKSVDPGALVVTAGTAPFGDPPPSGPRMAPALFWRVALCVQQVGIQLRDTHCKDPAHFDVLAHHPYSVGDPATTALNPDDVSIPDIGKLTKILRVAERGGTALPRIHHSIWVTEVGYNTKPPNPQGVPVAEDARWLEQTLELLWSQGVSLVTWNTIVDQAPHPNYFVTSQAGIYYLSGRPKPALTAFEFPIVAWRQHGVVEIWGRAPSSGRLALQIHKGNKWVTISSLNVHIGSTFLTHFVDTKPLTLRGQLNRLTSIAWPLR